VHWLFKRAQVAAPMYGSAGALRRRALALAAQRLGARPRGRRTAGPQT
jgi:hypothetical protein